MRTKRAIISYAVVGVGAIAVVVLLALRAAPTPADDSYRTTQLQTSNYNYTTGTVSSIVATMSTTSTSDATLHITIYRTPSGGSEIEVAGMDQPWESGSVGQALLAVPVSKFTSEDSVRAYFETKSSGGSSNFTYSRYTSIP